MNIDTQEINENVIPKINTSINSLNEAINNVKKIEIPKGFAYEAYLKNMPNNVTKIKNNVNDVKNKLTNTVTKFEEIERKNSQTISNLTSKIEGIGISDLRKTGSTKTASITSNNFWMTDTINKFSQRKYEIADNLNNNIKNKENETGAKSTSIWDSLYNTFVKPGVDFFEKCGAKISEFVTTAIGEISKGIEFFKNGINNLAKAGWNKMCEIKNNIEFAQKCTGAVISAGWNTLTSEILPAVGDFFKSLGASVANIVVGLLKGVCQFVESLVDLLGLVTGAYRLISLIKNAVPALYDIYVKKDYSNIDWNAFLNGYREEIMEDTMSIVAEDYVQNIYDSFFEETAVGQWLDENAWEMCKSDGTITNIAAGVGYVAGIIILTVVTCGAGSMAAGGASAASAATTTSFASTSAAIAAASGIGKGTQESWGKMRDASWEGVERLYEKGKITKEEYDNMYAIKYCTDEEWADVEKDYKSGVISKEKYEKMKEIREMPEDWKTAENYIKGLGFGVANGIWEGIQWYIGGKLAGWAIKGHKVATVATRVGVDTAFNGLDTPFRTAVDAVTYGKTWDEAWEEQGGWQSVVSNIGIGFIGSAGGEVFDAIKLNKASKILDNNEIFDNLDETTTREIKGLLLQEQQSGKIDISKMTKEQLDEAVNKKMLKNGINIIDKQHGYQLTRNDLGDFYKAKLQQGFFTEEQVDGWLDSINSKGYIDGETGKILKDLFDGDDRIFIKTIHSSDADSIMNEGIRCLGDSTSTGRPIPKDISDINLENTVTEITDGGLYELLTKLKSANGISQGGNPIDGAVIIRIPKDTSIEDIFKYNKELGLFNIDPKYNIGLFETDINGIVKSFNTFNLNDTFDAIKLNKASKILDNNEIFDNLDETTTREIKGLLLQEQQSGKIDISIMTKEQLDTLIDSKLLHNAINSIDEILSKESGIEESLAKDIRRSMQKEHGSGKIDIRKMTKQELEEEINKKIILKNYETTIDDFLEYLELDDITIKKIKNNFFDDLDKNIINSIMDKTQIGEKLEIAVHKTMNNKPQIKIDPEHGFQLTMQDIDIDGYCKAKLDEYYFWGEMIEDVTEERKAIEKSLIKELENLNSKGFIDTCDGYFLKELFDSNDTVYIKTIRANDIDNVVETAMKDGLGIESDLTSTAIKNMNSKGGLYGLIDKLKNLEDLNEGDTVVLIKSSYNEPLYGKVKPENIAGFITTDVNGNISIRRTKFDVNWLNPLMIDEEEGLKKSLEYVKNCTNAQYNIDEFRKLGDDIYKDLINSGYHENFAAEYTDTFIKRIVEDRGWQNIGEYKGVKINALTGLNIDHDELIKIFDEQVPASLFQYIDEINLSDLADDSRFGTIISYGNQIEGAASAIMGQRTVKVFDIKNFMFDDDFSGTMVHELAHNLDAHLSNISDTKAWRDAMKNDAMKSGNDIGCTPYATRTFNDVGKADEDFAEAVKLYTKDKELFKNKYSNRYEILKDILDY